MKLGVNSLIVALYLAFFFYSALRFPPHSLESMVRTISLLVTVEGILLGLLPLMVGRSARLDGIAQRNLIGALASLLASVTTIIVGESRELATGSSPVGLGELVLFALSILLFGVMTATYAYGVLSLSSTTASKEKRGSQD